MVSTTGVSIPLEDCGTSGMNGIPKELVVNSGLSGYQCLKTKNLTVVGNYYSNIYSFIMVEVRMCNN